jgi:hypothetical protein
MSVSDFSWFLSGDAYGFRGTKDSMGGIEMDVVKACSGGWVPSSVAFARISIACPVSGGMWIVAVSHFSRTQAWPVAG